MSIKARRHDHTAWVTHFVRDRKPEQDFPGLDEDESGRFSGGELEPDASAFEVLKTIIRLGGIIPGYSFRGGRTTIYGGRPAVCATEMPLYAFATYAKERAEAGNVSAYGISFLKSEFFESGGRPAIYGLSTDSVKYSINTSTCRVFEETVLPRQEQYRYVAHNPTKSPQYIDWSHEREWRWIPQCEDLDEVWTRDYYGVYGPVPALPIFKGELDGRKFTRVCIIVWSAEEAEEIKELLTGFYLAGSNNYGTPFDKGLIERSKIIVLEDVMAAVEQDSDIDAQTIEGLNKADLLTAIEIGVPPENAKEIVDKAFTAAVQAVKVANHKYTEEHGDSFSGAGFAHVTTADVTAPIVQYMLSTGRASGPYDGEVWIDCVGNQGSDDMLRGEAICIAAAKVISKDLKISAYMTSRWD